jgi:tRNA(His) 5'-end guanylyltransferase
MSAATSSQVESENASKSAFTLSTSLDIYTVLSTGKHDTSIPFSLCDRPPYLPRSIWNQLGDFISLKEKENCMILPATDCITIRLDIRGMSKLKRTLLRLKVLEQKWDPKLADMMIHVTNVLAKEYNVIYAYTQSDEITLILAPPLQTEESTKRLYEHPFGGRRDKLTSLSAALASVTADRYLTHLIQHLDESVHSSLPILQFDARVAKWSSLAESFTLILWRAYDCSVNGISDAVYNIKPSLSTLHTTAKLQWLAEQKLLPLPDHQAYGTLLYKERLEKTALDRRTGEEVKVMRGVYLEMKRRSVINMVKEQQLDLRMK